MMSKRKGMVIGLVIMLVAIVFSATALNVSSSTADMVSYWKFNEGSGNVAYDAVGDNDGTVIGATWTTSGVCGGALYFDGSYDYVIVPDDDTLDITDEITLEAWIKPEVTNIAYVLIKRSSAAGGVVYTLDIYPGKVRGFVVDPNGGNHGGIGTTTIKVDEWQHIALTYDGTTVKIFYNGVKEASSAFSGTIATSTGSVEIGLYSGGAGPPMFKGYIDEPAIYDRGLTEGEIKERYEDGLACLEAADADVDIDPDTLNPKSKGKWITAYIEVPGCDVSEIDVSTVQIAMIGQDMVSIHAEDHPSAVGDNDNDGEDDLMVKFSRQDLITALEPYEPTGEASMLMKGDFNDGQKFQEVGRWVFTGAGWKYFEF